MKTLKRVLTIILLVIVLAAAAGMIYLNSVKTRALPDYNAGIDLENLAAPVTVYRDSLGIPHIYAENEEDLYRTVGYVMAQDRMWQMDLLRRITTGRLSEVLDPGLVEADQLFRALEFSKKSPRVIEQTDPEILRTMEAFTDGINQYISKNQKKLSFEFTMLGYCIGALAAGFFLVTDLVEQMVLGDRIVPVSEASARHSPERPAPHLPSRSTIARETIGK